MSLFTEPELSEFRQKLSMKDFEKRLKSLLIASLFETAHRKSADIREQSVPGMRANFAGEC